MGAQADHIQQAEHNESLFLALDARSPTFTDWQMTSLFYAALHYIDAYLAIIGLHPKSHRERGRELASDQFLSSLFVDYQRLKDRSEDARYELISFNPEFVRELRANEYERLKTAIGSRLRLP